MSQSSRPMRLYTGHKSPWPCIAAVSSAAAAAFNPRNSKPHRQRCPKGSHGPRWDPKALGSLKGRAELISFVGSHVLLSAAIARPRGLPRPPQAKWLRTPRTPSPASPELYRQRRAWPFLLRALKDVADGLGVPLTTASRRDPSGVQCLRTVPQRRCARLLCFSDHGQHVRRITISLSLHGGHRAAAGHVELGAT